MQKGKFSDVATYPGSLKWDETIQRQNNLYIRKNDIRSEFFRDYNRILHCKAYRRLKHKTQVFFATTNDHICTRIEHVSHVASVSETISNYLGLNSELTRAIAIGHDLGHAPFGHKGEVILKQISNNEQIEPFWHEKNSLWFVDKLEMLTSQSGEKRNLSLTYGVRDGIISHCGEVNENTISPRNEAFDLYKIEKPNQYSPYTWEGCVVKIADKISYIGRDIEDAITLKILSRDQLKELQYILDNKTNLHLRDINNTVLIHNLIINLCKTSFPDKGICFSDEYLNLINSIKAFNYKNIYNHPRLTYFHNYAELIINSIFEILSNIYNKEKTIDEAKRLKDIYPNLSATFTDWLITYAETDVQQRNLYKFENEVIYDLNKRDDYIKAIIHYISSMTDQYAISLFNEITKF
ncbi:MAG: HD domain-containing protein [Bacteroidales bacterium]|nr:HD domain-containing protein [Bacteroidales bacterium]